MRMLIVGYCMGIRSERRLCEEVFRNLAYRWFCRLGLDGKVPDHSTFSRNRHGRFRESDMPYTQDTLELIAEALRTTPAALLSSGPVEDERTALWSMRERASPTQRRKIAALVKAVLDADRSVSPMASASGQGVAYTA